MRKLKAFDSRVNLLSHLESFTVEYRSVPSTGCKHFGFLNAVACLFSLIWPQARGGSSWLLTFHCTHSCNPPQLPAVQALFVLEPGCLASQCLPSHLVLLKLHLTEQQGPSEVVGAEEAGDACSGVASELHLKDGWQCAHKGKDGRSDEVVWAGRWSH